MGKTQALNRRLLSSVLAFALALSMGFGYVFAGTSTAYADEAADQTEQEAATDIATAGIKNCGQQLYLGEDITPYDDSVKNGDGIWLNEGVDYTVAYSGNTGVGTATATLTGIGAYTGTVTFTFEIVDFEFTLTDENGAVAYSFTYDEIEYLMGVSQDNTEDLSYQYFGKKGASVVYVPAKQYVTIDTLMAAAQCEDWTSVSPAASDGFAATITADVNDNGKFYPAATADNFDTTGGVNVPAVIAFKWASAPIETTSGAAITVAAGEELESSVRDFAGIVESEFKADGAVAGNRFVTGVVSMGTKDAFASGKVSDLEDNAWYLDYVAFAVNAGIITGYGDGSLFGPNDNLERAQVATILYRAAPDTDSSLTLDSSKFATVNTTGKSDVEAGQYYTAAVNWAIEEGIFSGDGGSDTFRPRADIQRQELGKVLALYASKVYGVDITSFDASAAAKIADWDTVAPWARDYLLWTATTNIMSGNPADGGMSTMDPAGYATRAQMAKMMVMLLETQA